MARQPCGPAVSVPSTGAFSLLRENFSHAPSLDMKPASLSMLEQLMTAQAQECVFESLSLPAPVAPDDFPAQLRLAQEAAQVRMGSPCSRGDLRKCPGAPSLGLAKLQLLGGHRPGLRPRGQSGGGGGQGPSLEGSGAVTVSPVSSQSQLLLCGAAQGPGVLSPPPLGQHQSGKELGALTPELSQLWALRGATGTLVRAGGGWASELVLQSHWMPHCPATCTGRWRPSTSWCTRPWPSCPSETTCPSPGPPWCASRLSTSRPWPTTTRLWLSVTAPVSALPVCLRAR